MLKLTEARKRRIISEIDEYANYDTNYSRKEWDSDIDFLKSDKHLMNSIISFDYYYFPKMVLQYFYCHVDNDGNLKRLRDLAEEDPYIKKHMRLYERANKDFVHYLVYRDRQLFFIDFDNTLLVDGRLSKQKRDYIKNFNYKEDIIITTTKQADELMPILKQLDLQDNYYVCLNGAAIYKGDELIKSIPVGDNAEKIVCDLKKANIDFVAFYENECILIKDIEEYPQEDRDLISTFTKVEFNYKEIEYPKVLGFAFLVHKGNKEKEEKINKIIKKYDDVYAFRSRENLYEVMNVKNDKGTAERFICEELNRYYRCSVGVGDSMTDFPLLSLTGHSYVVSTATPELKEKNFKQLIDDREFDIVKVLKKYENRDIIRL